MKTLRALRALARVELRQIRQYPRRSLLVILLVAVPVAAVVGGSTLAGITEMTVEEQQVQRMGAAALRIGGITSYDDIVRVQETLPVEATLERLFVGIDDVSVPGVRLQARLFAVTPEQLTTEGLARGMVVMSSGRPPSNAGEVALSPALLEGLDRQVGGRVTLEFGPQRTITGIVQDPEQLDAPLVLRVPAAAEHRGHHGLLIDLPTADIDTVAAKLRESELTVDVRHDVGGRGDTGTLILALGTIGFFEAALVIAAAFAVSIRRRQREIGLLGAAGATVRGLWSALLASAAAVALLGGALGVVAGAAFAAVLHPFLDDWNQRLNGAFEVAAGHAIAGLLLGLLTAVLAATVPARSAARLPIRVALSGRRPAKHSGRSWLWIGMPMVVVGFLLTLMAHLEHQGAEALGVVVGPILGIVGFGLCSPWLLGFLASKAAPLPLPWRLAVRDAGRFRTRNGPVVTAILAGMSMSVTVAILVTSLESAISFVPAPYRDDQLLIEGSDAETVARRIAEDLSAVALAPLSIVYAQGEPVRAQFLGDENRLLVGKTIATGNHALLRVMHAEGAQNAFNAGKLVALDPPSQAAVLNLTSWVSERPIETLPVHLARAAQRLREPAFLVHEDILERRDLEPGPPLRRTITPWLVRLSAPVTPQQLAQSRAIAADSVGTSIDASLLQQRPATDFYWVMLALCVFTGVVIVLIANALTAAESAGDERVLHTVGAAPSLIRSHLAARAGYLAFLGCVLAVPGGMLPTLGLIRIAKLPMDLVVPWQAVASTLLILPAVAYASAWGLSALRRTSAASLQHRVALVALLAATAPWAANASPTEVRWQPFTGEAFDGSPLAGELGHLIVPENRAKPNGAAIELAFVRFRTTNPDPGAPIFFLTGGPGGAGSEVGPKYATHPQIRLLEHRDVIAIDQRGTGQTHPNLVDLELRPDLPLDRAVTRDHAIAAFGQAVERCVDHWRGEGVDLSAYNTQESADDIDAVRQALGLQEIMLFGSSYGSHLGLAYLRRHGEHVSRAALFKVEGPDHTWKLPSTVQEGLQKLHDEVAGTSHLSQSIPDLLGLVSRLREQLRQQPISAIATPETTALEDVDDTDDTAGTASTDAATPEVAVLLGPYDFEAHVSYALASIQGIAALPAQLHAMSKGDWTSLAASAVETRGLGINGMTLMMDCMSGSSVTRRRQIKRERGDSANLLSDAIMAPFYPQSCDAIGFPTLGDEFRSPIRSDVPVLFVSGDLDIRTPAANVEDLRGGFPNQAHIVVENASHGGRELMSPEYRRLLQAFLRGQAVGDTRIALPRLRFDAIVP